MNEHSRPEPAPFFLEGGSIGVLLLHGFTGSPPEMYLVGEYLHRRGYTVSAPLLPGHGTSVEDLNRCRWTDWTDHAAEALSNLQDRCETVFVGGLSMGALVTMYLAAHHPELAGAMFYSPPTKLADRSIYLTPILKFLKPAQPKSGRRDMEDPHAERHIWHYDAYPLAAAHELLKLMRQARILLPQVTCPLLVIHGAHDELIHAKSAQYTLKHAGSTDKELVTLRHSGHILTVNSDWLLAAKRSCQFIQKHLG